MRFIISQLTFFLAQKSNRRNMRFMLRFTLLILGLILVYSILFSYLMAKEGQNYSPLTGLYWTLTVMSTLGFGEITFVSDLGKIFTIVVLLSGILLFMLVMPFTFIRFVYSPWLDAQSKALTPRELPRETREHILIVGTDMTALNVADRLHQYAIPYALLCDDNQQAIDLYDKRYNVVLGDLDSVASYASLRVGAASLALALHDDLKNTNIAATVRESSSSVPIAASVNKEESIDILHLAGCNHVFHFSRLLGIALARRVFSARLESNIIGRFEGFCIAESPAHGTPFAGQQLKETELRERFGLNVIGIWQGNQYMPARPDTVIDDRVTLLLAGTADVLEKYDRSVTPPSGEPEAPVLILGGGRVGAAVAETLEKRGISFKLVEQKAILIPKDDSRYVLGSAADIHILRAAGIDTTQAVVVTTHNDDLNIYLTIYCRKLRPDIQIISRAVLDRNIASLYAGGANLVMSQASMTANTVINLIHPGRVFTLTEGLNVFRVSAPPSLVDVTLLDSRIRRDTDCNVVAVRSRGEIIVPPEPDVPIRGGDELILIGTVEAEKKFMRRYCQ